MNARYSAIAALACCAVLATASAADRPRDPSAVLASLDGVFEKFMRDQHVPGLVYGVVIDGKLARVRAFGVSNVPAGTPVTADTAFRIASMSKQFTALAMLRLRDAGRVSLDAPAEKYVPELRKLRYPTSDSARITVRDLLSHAAGFVTDDPWGDRQLDMSEADFTRFVSGGVPFSRAPGMAYEYSNFGFALVGRVVSNTSRTNYSRYITDSFLQPLGMPHTVWDIAAVPATQRAAGYRWENEAWIEEPVLGPGVFGAMGGLITTANDYARYVAWLLAAWPPRDGAEDGILKRSSIREITRPANYVVVRPADDPAACPRAASYGFGVIPFSDCILGFHFGHSGGLPGYGSNVLFLPNRGVAVFAFANRTYAPAARVVREAANLLAQSGAFPERAGSLSPALRDMSRVVERIYDSGDVLTAREALAPNFLLDHTAAIRNPQIADLRQKLGKCRLADTQQSDNAMSATLALACEGGALKAKVILAPTTPPTLQTLEFVP
jgi:D-alanyl-D-alanine-carboxypeptidase/D-alanyl-D-alanine-endopeptidase